MRRGKSISFIPGRPITVIEKDYYDPEKDEVLVQVLLAGICGTDVHRVAGDIDVKKGSEKAIYFGHEVIGKIVAKGTDVTRDRFDNTIAIGDILYWCPIMPCGTCWECSLSNALQCKEVNWPASVNDSTAAGFQQYATLTARSPFVRVPQEVSLESVIAFGCAMPTALRGIARLGEIKKGTDIVIQGSGPVGLACTLLASLAGARSIIVIGDPQNRLAIAKTLGATAVLSVSATSIEERRKHIDTITNGRGASTVIEAAGFASAFTEGIELLGINGKYLILGLYSGNAKCVIDPVRINNYNLEIIGSLGMKLDTYRETVTIAATHDKQFDLARLVTHKFPLEQFQEAIDVVKTGGAVKAVIVP
jgi:5-exo-hydroxycamphor dehydrogenase